MGHVATNFQSSGSGWPLTRAINFGTNSGRWAVVHVSGTSGATCTGVTVGSDTLTQRATGSGLGGGNQWVFEGPVTGTGSQTVTASGTGSGICWMTASAYDGIGSYRSSSAAVASSATGTPSLTISGTTAGDICWAGGNDNTAGKTATAVSPATLLAANAGEWAIQQVATGSSESLAASFSSGSWQWGGVALVPSGGGDVTAPVLSSPVGTATGPSTATVGATTDEGNGTLYVVVTTSATQPSVAQIKAGQNHTGAAAAFASSVTVTSTGAKTFSATGLTPSTGYYAHLVHTDAASNDSNRVTSSLFTTNALPGLTSNPIKNNTGTLLTSQPFEAYVSNPSTGALVLKKTGLTSHATTGVITFTDAALTASTSYRVVWRQTSTGAEGLETLTAA